MPTVQIEILVGRTLDQKRQMVKGVTEVIGKTLNCAPEAVSIIIREVASEHFAKGGVLRVDQS